MGAVERQVPRRCRGFLRAENGSTLRVRAPHRRAAPICSAPTPARSINFVTAHDGFTLYDLVSYERKHNGANGHGNTDGTDDNRTWNCGWEGDDIPDDVAAGGDRALRLQQMKNAMVLLMLSAGTPMMLAGDEFAQTQGGNNNPYNQDNDTTWLHWERAAEFAEPDHVRPRRDQVAPTTRGDGQVVLHGVDPAPDLGFTSYSIAWQRGRPVRDGERMVGAARVPRPRRRRLAGGARHQRRTGALAAGRDHPRAPARPSSSPACDHPRVTVRDVTRNRSRGPSGRGCGARGCACRCDPRG